MNNTTILNMVFNDHDYSHLEDKSFFITGGTGFYRNVVSQND